MPRRHALMGVSFRWLNSGGGRGRRLRRVRLEEEVVKEGGRWRQAAEPASVQLRGDDDDAAAAGRLRVCNNVMQRQRVSYRFEKTTMARTLAGAR